MVQLLELVALSAPSVQQSDCGTGAGERAGRRGALDRNAQGEEHRDSVPSPCAAMYAALFSFPAATFPRRPMYAGFLHFVDNSSLSLVFKVRIKASLLGIERCTRIA